MEQYDTVFLKDGRIREKIKDEKIDFGETVINEKDKPFSAKRWTDIPKFIVVGHSKTTEC